MGVMEMLNQTLISKTRTSQEVAGFLALFVAFDILNI